MIEIVESVNPNHPEIKNRAVQQWYAFALNRRGVGDDREKALNVVLALLGDNNANSPDLQSLAGRIYKDKYYDSK